jgi:hypothetical protein
MSLHSGLEFAYSQSPKYLQGIVMALFLSTAGLGAFLGAVIVKITSTYSNWLCSDLNRCHLENYFYLLAGLSFVNLVIFILVSTSYSYTPVYSGACISRDPSSQTAVSPTDISDICDVPSDEEYGASSRIDLSRQSSYCDVSSMSEDEQE